MEEDLTGRKLEHQVPYRLEGSSTFTPPRGCSRPTVNQSFPDPEIILRPLFNNHQRAKLPACNICLKMWKYKIENYPASTNFTPITLHDTLQANTTHPLLT
uniref:Uncharacterized protein n=1 Tax=Pyxicephalus adspersus TaxID=30357 RepID=A0AAV3AET3_PYXAD|nr:TPA: hypothetical protein GDO54_010493 [Pyxicephalus adspersus]